MKKQKRKKGKRVTYNLFDITSWMKCIFPMRVEERSLETDFSIIMIWTKYIPLQWKDCRDQKGNQGMKKTEEDEEQEKKGIREPRRHDEGFRWRRRSLERNLERHTYKLVGLSPSHAVWYSCWMSLSFLTHDSLIKGQKILISLLSACISWSFPSNFFTTPESFSIFFLLILVTLRISVLLRLWLCKESEMQANGDDDERKGTRKEEIHFLASSSSSCLLTPSSFFRFLWTTMMCLLKETWLCPSSLLIKWFFTMILRGFLRNFPFCLPPTLESH